MERRGFVKAALAGLAALWAPAAKAADHDEGEFDFANAVPARGLDELMQVVSPKTGHEVIRSMWVMNLSDSHVQVALSRGGDLLTTFFVQRQNYGSWSCGSFREPITDQGDVAVALRSQDHPEWASELPGVYVQLNRGPA